MENLFSSEVRRAVKSRSYDMGHLRSLLEYVAASRLGMDCYFSGCTMSWDSTSFVVYRSRGGAVKVTLVHDTCEVLFKDL